MLCVYSWDPGTHDYWSRFLNFYHLYHSNGNFGKNGRIGSQKKNHEMRLGCSYHLPLRKVEKKNSGKKFMVKSFRASFQGTREGEKLEFL